ncbi:hypothetical protein AK812_SmicGene19549 [Symbiodinium microadriaticum]|uniref:Uncharacterized protein n=1 Tax=Symbiodinium microadriaticum TaxID=2951 RepID=A0A1Q9DSE4_SYMMI|nr:hypothetical protein AK812_SmicGene19549 [Symbiodinium microadriaticum]CAE7636980.1 unnamed protein product [Symbiodinium sp. KB8]
MLSAGAAKTLKACCCVAWRRWLSADRVSSGGSQEWTDGHVDCFARGAQGSVDGAARHIQNVLCGASHLQVDVLEPGLVLDILVLQRGVDRLVHQDGHDGLEEGGMCPLEWTDCFTSVSGSFHKLKLVSRELEQGQGQEQGQEQEQEQELEQEQQDQEQEEEKEPQVQLHEAHVVDTRLRIVEAFKGDLVTTVPVGVAVSADGSNSVGAEAWKIFVRKKLMAKKSSATITYSWTAMAIASILRQAIDVGHLLVVIACMAIISDEHSESLLVLDLLVSPSLDASFGGCCPKFEDVIIGYFGPFGSVNSAGFAASGDLHSTGIWWPPRSGKPDPANQSANAWTGSLTTWEARLDVRDLLLAPNGTLFVADHMQLLGWHCNVPNRMLA